MESCTWRLRRVAAMSARLALCGLALVCCTAEAQDTLRVRPAGDSVSLRFVDSDLRGVLRSLAPYLRKPLLSGEVPSVRVSLETPSPVPVQSVEGLLRALLAVRALELQEDSLSFRVVPMSQIAVTAAPSAPVIADVSLHLITLKHARAEDVAATINALFGVGGGGTARRGLSSGTLGGELERLANATTAARDPAGMPVQGSLVGPVTMVPDSRTNSLLVRGAPGDVRVIRDAVAQLDLRPLQVLLEVLMVEASKERTLDLAVGGEIGRGSARDSIAGSLASANPAGLVLRVMRMSRTDLTVSLGAAAARGEATIVSRPVVVVANNAEARFLVGSQRPFVQVSRSLPTDVPTRDQVIQYRDVGTKLVVRPSINQDGYVALLIQQEMSSATEETQFGAPVISTREASTEVLVKDGQTMVLGGLSDSTRSRAQSGVPLLSRIPGVGLLFGQTRRRSVATEFFLFITPHVIRDDADIERLTTPRLPEHRNDR